MRRFAIIGGGIAGLSAAYYLEKTRRNGTELEWKLFERSERLGGVIRTEYRDGCVLEAGPDSFLSVKPEAAELCRELGLGDQLLQSNDAQRKTYIVVRGKLVPLPDGLQFMVPTRLLPMVATSLFSFSTKLRMAKEWVTPAVTHAGDESVAAFVSRHFGQEMVDRVAEPLLAGVYGGQAVQLSMRAVLPRFVEMERQHGSLVRATLKARKAAGNAAPQPLFTSLKRGMQQLVDALVSAVPAASLGVRQQVSCRRRDDGWEVAGEKFDGVFLGVPAPAASAALVDASPVLKQRLASIQYTSSAAVLFAVEQPQLPPGFGFLAPASEQKKMLACTFVHKKFSYRAPEGVALLRCFFSSSRVPDLLDHSDEDLKSIALRELKDILRVNLQPAFDRVFRWQYGLPQYDVGHVERAAEIEAEVQQMPGIYLIGNSLYGIGVPDCIRSAKQAVERAVSH